MSARVQRPSLLDAAGLAPSVDLPTAASWLGIGRTHAYALQAAGQFPVPVLRLGRVIRVPTAALLHLLGLPVPVPTAASASEAPPSDPGRDGAREEPAPGGEEPS